MPTVGDTATATLTVDPYAGDTVAVLQLIAPDGTATTLGAASSDGRHTWRSNVTYTAAGIWQLAWTVTGTGAGAQTERVSVGIATLPTTWRTYATTTDLAAYLDGDEIPDNAGRLLRDATVMIDRLLISAQYPTDVNDMPADPRHIAALRDATCEQVNWWLQTGDPNGARSAFASLHIGSISIAAASAGTRSGPRSSTRIGPQVIAILENVGLFGQPPVVW